MSAPDVRCEGDLHLHTLLLDDDAVKAVCREVEENPAGSVRRQLLATSLRLTESMSPKLHRMLLESSEKLGVTIPVESYVYNSPTFNAACIKPEDGTLLLMFSSALLEKFAETELRFVMGHELGHHLFGHHEIPIGSLVSGKKKIGPRLALQLFSWSRYAEISADRAGALCAANADAAASTLFKLASGLTTELIEIRIEEFAAQADEMDLERKPGKDDSRSKDWFMTHPFTPLRVQALQVFFGSNLIQQDGISRTQLEADVHQLMAMMSPTYLEEKSEVAETMRRVLFAAGCGLMKVSGEISQQEIAAFDQLFGAGTFAESLDFDRLEQLLDKRIAQANQEVPRARRIHIVRDLALIAVADGRVTQKERQYVYGVGRKLKIPPEVIEHSFQRDSELD